MKVSLQLIKKLYERYGTNDDPTAEDRDKLLASIGSQLGAIEQVEDLGQKYSGVVVARVVGCEKHPNADKLSVCLIDDGGVVEGVQRNDKNQVSVVCGAPNARAGLLVAWIPPGAVVPATFHKEPFRLDARDIRGVISNGMLASAHELDLSDDHSGILEMEDDVPAGTHFAEALGLNDTIIDIENKMFTHRPDCFGFLGVARELAGIRQIAFKSPDWYISAMEVAPGSETLPLEVRNEAPELVPRFMAVAMSGVKVGSSPLWLQSALTRLGVRPINNIVDLTNYFMLETGQPLHAYDYDKVKAASAGDKAVLVARKASNNESVSLLNGKTAAFSDPAIVIATDKQAIGLGGIMGGKDTEVDGQTTNIILECATFDMYAIRRTSMHYGLFTEASTRFTKGQSPLQNDRVLAKVVDDVRRLTGGQVASQVADEYERLPELASVSVSAAFINDRLGLNLPPDEMAQLLRNVEFEVEVSDAGLKITAPFWRTDIEIPEDIVEEVGRLYGYDQVPLVLPKKDLTPARKDRSLEFKQRLREAMAAAGANELLTYSFVHGDLLEKTGQNPDDAYHLRNAQSPDLQHFRMSLLPSLLLSVHPNLKSDMVRSDDNEFALFEIGKAHTKDRQTNDLPDELERLAFVFAADDKTAARKYGGAAYYEAKKYLMWLLNGNAVFEPLGDNPDPLAAPFEPNRSALVKVDDEVLGVIGEFKASVRQRLKLPVFSAGFELDLTTLLEHQSQTTYQPLPAYPKTVQDICFRLPDGITYQRLFDFVWAQLMDAKQSFGYYPTLGPLDIFQPDNDSSHKQVTLRLWLSHYERTLKTEEVNQLISRIAEAAKTELQAERV